MSGFNRGDYEPRRSDRQRSRAVRYVLDDDEDDSDDVPVSSGRKNPRRVCRSSDDFSSDVGLSEDEPEYDEQQEDDEDDESSDAEVRPRPPPRRQRVKKKTYFESTDEEEEESDEERNDDDDGEEQDDEDEDSPRKKTTPKAGDVMSLFEEPDEPTIEKILDSRHCPDGGLEYQVKWKGRSYIHTSWHREDDLMKFKGFRILCNFIKQAKARETISEHVSAEQLEQMHVSQEMALQKRQLFTIPERILEQRVYSDGIRNEYLVKWTDLPYSACTWEKVQDLQTSQILIDSFLERTRSSGKSFNRSHQSTKGTFRKFETQPEWMGDVGTLRDYQLEGLNWLRFSHMEKRNVILADEMGLGKTIQCISFLGSLHADLGNPGPYLVVVPLSTISAWKREFAKWTPWLNVIEYRGNVSARAVCRQFEWGPPRHPRFNVLLINYEVANKDAQYLNQFTWPYLLVDEAHRLKDDQSLLYQTLKAIRSTNRLLITGTPLQNSVKELWCLLHFLDPQKFNNLDEFQSLYGEITESTASVRDLSRLHEMLKPYLLRRTKADVLKSLPSKTERILRIDMSDMQKRYYRWVLTKNFNELNKGLKGGNMSSLSNTIIELKKVSNHPYLFDNAELKHHETVQQELARMVSNSGKMILLDRLLDRLFETEHRVLIFSQMVRMLDILADYLVLKGFKFQRLDGGMSSEDRQHAMDHFNADGSQDFVFLLSTRAGGLGVNLATADTVIIFDSDWNPQNDLQAEARAHRIGQKKTVNIYRFVTKGTIEEDILERAKRKMILDHLVIQKMDTSGRSALINERKQGAKRSQFDKADLMRIVEFGARQLFEESQDTNLGDNPNSTPANTNSMALDLDEILARAETNDGAEQQVDQTDEFLSAFKFANFVSSAPEDQVVVKTNAPAAPAEDGSFWEKVIPAHLRPTKTTEEELVFPRRARFGKALADDGVDSDVDIAPRRRPISKKTSSKKQIGERPREIKHAAKAIMQFGDTDRAASTMTGDRQQNYDLIEHILHECQGKEKVTLEGVEIDALALRGRVADMAMLKRQVEAVEEPYDRFRVTAQIGSVRWKCSWGVRHDSMLLLGAHLYGFGAWNDILNDKRLGIGAVIQKSNSNERIVGNSHLTSRLLALFRAMRSQEEKRRSASNHIGHKRKASGEVESTLPERRPRPPNRPLSEVIPTDPKVSSWCLSTMKESKAIVKTLMKLKVVQRGGGLSSDPQTVIKYLFRIGDYITRTGNEDRCPFASPRIVEHHLWSLAAPFVQSAPGALSSLYWDLAAADPSATSTQHAILTQFEARRTTRDSPSS